MSRIAKFSARWLSTYGLSIGINDITPFASFLTYKEELLKKGYKECDEEIEKFKSGQITLNAGCNADQTVESNLSGKLSKLRETAGDMLSKNLPRHNAPRIMAVSGSKGSILNLC